MLEYSVKNRWLGNSLIYRDYIIYRLKLSQYLLCFNKKYLKYYYPYHYQEAINKAIKKKKIKADRNIVFSLVREESRFDRLALSPSHAMGLFQIIPPTGKYIKKKLKYKTDDTIYNVYVNSLFGIYYFNSWLKENNIENMIYALCSYNAGYKRLAKWKESSKYKEDYPEIFIELIPYNETRNYVKKVLTSYYLYSQM